MRRRGILCVQNGQCIAFQEKCDRVPDCPGETDEGEAANCPAEGECREDEFRCSDGQCIPLIQRCDGILHCTPADPNVVEPIVEDEEGCDELCPDFATFCDETCETGEPAKLPFLICQEFDCECGVACKDPNNVIDRIRYVNDDPAACADLQYDCRPNEEKFTDLCGCGCEAEEFVCGPGDFTCADGTCIPEDNECNFEYTNDCADNSDEWPLNQNCGRFEDCEGEGLLRCRSGECYEPGWRCDAMDDCLSGEDEEGCN